MSARNDVLSRVRTALHGAPPPGPVPRDYRSRSELPAGGPALLDLLVERITDYRATVHRTDRAGLAAAVATAVRHGLGDRPARLVVPPGLPTAWLAGLAAGAVEVVVDDGLTAQQLDELDGTVTGARVAIAETGTFVLDAAPDQGRRVLTLVPDLHVCVLLAEQVVGTVPEAVARLDPTRPLTWVSGPSATSDIELVRVEGVHGPRTLEVVLVE